MRTLFFDANDYRLLELLNDALNSDLDSGQVETLLTPYLRPHGIKELAASSGLRIAYATVHLLESLNSRKATERINALTALRDEVFSSSKGQLRLNRARVMIQIIKELIRSKGNPGRQLEFAHDFRSVASGRPSFVRDQLRKYHLLEMPEDWNQVSFDNRVHDANSKGRKSATHLMMDAWIKGIRRLTVVYYNYVDRKVLEELFSSAAILGITVQVAIEFKSVFRGRFVKLDWTPSKLRDKSDIESFFSHPGVSALMEDGKKAQQKTTDYVKDLAALFNSKHRASIEQEFGISLPHIDFDEMVRSEDCLQPSVLHLGKYIHRLALPLFIEKVKAFKKEYPEASYDRQAEIAMHVESLKSLDADTIVARYLQPSENTELPDPDKPGNSENEPLLLRMTPKELSDRIHHISHSSDLTLILSGLSVADVIEIIYDCKGKINYFETFSIKTYQGSSLLDRLPFNSLQKALNEQNAVVLKRIIHDCIDGIRSEEEKDPARELRLLEILDDFDSLRSFYKFSPLRTSIGSGSTGQSSRNIGMGFVVLETLPRKAQKEAKSKNKFIPAQGKISFIKEFVPPSHATGLRRLLKPFYMAPLVRSLYCRVDKLWEVKDFEIIDEGTGNLVPLGGINYELGNDFDLFDDDKPVKPRRSFRYLNRNLINISKVLCGFIPAFLTFSLTKDWWVLAYLGAFIWFGITGVRNIIQAVLGGGGFKRSPFLPWNEYVSWDRIADSLFYTGFSVPLLDWLCKTLLLKDQFGIDTTTAPLILYSIMALTNGMYITGHNIFRGLPSSAAAANFFRSVLSIPIALVFNWIIGLVLISAGHADVDVTLQLWAAVISKLASDCVAGIIEGIADRNQNIKLRRWDYSEKLHQIFDTFSALEVSNPQLNMLDIFEQPEKIVDVAGPDCVVPATTIVANALDLMYFRYYQPRASDFLQITICSMSEDERRIFFAYQMVLSQEKTVARMFVDGLVGKNFSKALSFYLLKHRDYLNEIKKRMRFCLMDDRQKIN
ncbi:hypothetical protein [Maridesulfovibrio bastinii]|uniref:hypothetical protein n=1 Tax=Maridesulfovibrio bastinii TaxID=47157 RepID=UPI00042390E0|nr:hypothetical protein [Maridesulfovibrio bastinii]